MKKIIIPSIVIAIVMIVGLIGLNNSRAQNTNDYPVVVQNLVDQFDLDTNVVDEVIAETRDEKHNLVQGKHEEKLNQAVIDGLITEEQKSAILAMKSEFFNKHSELSSLSFEERREAKSELKEKFNTWAEENGIDLKQLYGFNHEGGKHGYKNWDYSK